MAFRRRQNRAHALVTVAFDGQHWESYFTSNGRERVKCLCEPCPAQGDYSRKDALDRHLVTVHKRKTLRRLPVRPNRANKQAAPYEEIGRRHPTWGFVRFAVPAQSADNLNAGLLGLEGGQRAFKQSAIADQNMASSSTHPLAPSAASIVPAILNRGRSAIANEQSGSEHGSPAYHGVHRTNKLKLKRVQNSGCPSTVLPVLGSQDLHHNYSVGHRLPEPLSPIELTKYSPRQLKVSGNKSIFQTIFLGSDDEKSPSDVFYKDCEPPRSGPSTRGGCEARPIRIGVSPNKALAYGIPGEGTLNAKWDDGGKATFFLPVLKRKLKLGEDVNEGAMPDVEPPVPMPHVQVSVAAQECANEAIDFNMDDISLTLPTVSQLISTVHVGAKEGSGDYALLDIDVNVALPEKSLSPLHDDTPKPLHGGDGQAKFTSSQMPYVSQLPSLSELSLPTLEDSPHVPEYSDITSMVPLVDYAFDSAFESYEM